MKLHSIIRAVCLLASIACLALAYVPTGDWLVLLVIPAMLLFWVLTKKRSAFWPASSLLTVYVLLALMGVTRHTPLLLVIGCVFALAGWDLNDLSLGTVGQGPRGAGAELEMRRLQSLALMTGISVALAAVSLWLRLQLSFGAIVLLVLLVTGCLLYTVHHLRKSSVEFGRQN